MVVCWCGGDAEVMLNDTKGVLRDAGVEVYWGGSDAEVMRSDTGVGLSEGVGVWGHAWIVVVGWCAGGAKLGSRWC